MLQSYLTLKLLNEYFAVNVNNVTEVIEPGDITEVPETPDYIRGIMNFRGDILPIIDLRIKFNMPEKIGGEEPVVIVLDMIVNDKKVVLGAIADSVRNVIEVDINTITKLPEIGTKFNTEYIYGIIKKNDDFIVLLDIEKIFSVDEITIILEMN